MKRPIQSFIAMAGTVLSASAATIEIPTTADAAIYHRDGTYGYNSTNYGSAVTTDAGQFGGGIWSMTYIRFDLSAIPAGATITTATFQITTTGSNNVAGFPVARADSFTTGRFGTYGLLDVDGNTSQLWDEMGITGNSAAGERVSGTNPQFDTATRTIDLSGESESIASGIISVTGSSLASFLQDRLDATTNTGLATIMVDFTEDASGGARGFTFASRENTSSLQVPTLVIEYSVVPEPSITLLSGLGLLGLIRRRR